MAYPRKNHYLVFQRNGRDLFGVTNAFTGEEWQVNGEYARFLMALDGRTDPYTIDPDLEEEDVEALLADMEEEGHLDPGKKIRPLGFGSVLIPLWIPRVKGIHRLLGAVWNRLLLLSWLPLLVMGGKVLLDGSWNYVECGWGTLTGNLLGLGVGLLLHEMSHAAACIGYGTKTQFLECGLVVHYFLPGAYVMIDDSALKNRFRRAQIQAAGIECNLALCGLFLCALKLEMMDSMALIIAAALNGILALFNTSLIEGLDGMAIFREALGCEDFLDRAKGVIFSRQGKRLLRERGIHGRATLAACYIIVFLQVLLPLVLVLNVICVMEWMIH